MESAKEVWEKALGELQIHVSKANYSTWLSSSQGISCQDNIFIVGIPNTFVAEWLSTRLYPLVKQTLTNIMGRDIDIRFTVPSQGTLQTGPLAPASQPDGGTSSKATQYRFNPKYTFDNFVVGNLNRLAYAASVEVAEKPGCAYNPLFLHSTTGQGKTHLLHAIGHVAAKNGLQAAYTTSERFTNEFVLAVRQKRVEDFRSKFRDIHVLLFDDVQFLANKKQTLECFLHIFCELHNNNRQIVIAADRSPEHIASFNNKLRSRLQWGLVADIQPPDFETRLAILQAKATDMMTPGLEEALRIIAERLHDNVRQLEGALAYLTARAKLTGVNITPETINKLLTGTSHNPDTRLIATAVADYFDLPIEELTGKKRDRRAVLARQITMYLMREESSCSFAEIGKELGDRNHATVLHGHEKIAREMSIDHNLRTQISEIKDKINLHKSSSQVP
ncbi:MAG: chromosomal replication initiator protein DnaA [Dehalococcoidia bacterium]|nr:chromosomal replication initiator protein DnaA [Dehalococcoidia bacterium]